MWIIYWSGNRDPWVRRDFTENSFNLNFHKTFVVGQKDFSGTLCNHRFLWQQGWSLNYVSNSHALATIV